MGNILVSQQRLSLTDPHTTPGLIFTASWLSLLGYLVYKLIIEKPWGQTAVYKRLIAENEQRRQQRFDEARKRCEGLDSTTRDEILRLSLFELRDALQHDKYTAQTVLAAYSWKALQIQAKLNPICEFLLEAFDLAKELDEKYGGKENKPPLFGVPFSVKENFFLKGYDSNIGVAKLINNPQTDECTLVTHLKSQGAIPFAYTNVPQTLLNFVCSNSVYGTTGNPHDPARTPGGSSGGDACLVAAGGTPFGTGSDLAGSLRIPANLCGIVTLKPTEARLVVKNAHGGIPGRGRLGLSYGFFTHSVDEQIFLLENILGSEDYRKLCPKNVPLPLNLKAVESEKKTLRIGYWLDDGFLKPTPGPARVVRETIEKLKAEGHELVHFRLPKPNIAAEAVYKAVLPDGGAYLLKLFDGEVIDPYFKQFVTLLKLPYFVRWLGAHALSPFSSQMSLVARSYNSNIEQLRQAQQLLDDYCIEFANQWTELGLDALVVPSFVVPAVPHEFPSQLGPCGFATALFNMLDYPAGIVPTGTVLKEDDEALQDEKEYPTGPEMPVIND
ncbi:amidase [Aphelenchoides avenae]|nr:amidase [Aphelenchus avenae]